MKIASVNLIRMLTSKGFLFVCLFIPIALHAQISGRIILSAESLENEDKTIALYKNWKYHPGDQLEWANPEFDDRAWEIAADSRLFLDNLPKSGWEGIGWFRLHLQVDRTLWNRPLTLNVYHPGASEIYLNGKLSYRFGRVGLSSRDEEPYGENNPRVILLEDRPDVVVAIRYSGFSVSFFKHLNLPIGFSVVLSDPNQIIATRSSWIRSTTAYQMFFSGVPITFALLHLFLFLFYPRARANLYFAMSAVGIGAYIFANFQGRYLTDDVFFYAISDLGRTSLQIYYVAILWRISIILTVLSSLRFLYALFCPDVPKQFWYFVAGGIVFGVWSLARPIGSWDYFNLYTLVGVVEMLRIMSIAVGQKKEGARLICFGFLPLMVGTVYLLMRNLDVIEHISGFNNVFYYGVQFLLFSMSLHLSRDFARTRLDLEKQLVQVRELFQTNLELRQGRALEQVRAEAAAMQESQDIVNVVAALWEGLEVCGLDFEAVGIAVAESGRRRVQFYAAAETAGYMVSLLPDFDRNLFQTDVVEGVHLWRTEIPLSQALGLKAQPGLHTVDEYFQVYLNKLWGITDMGQELRNRPIIETHFHHGYLSAMAAREGIFTENDLQVVEEFAEAISLGYTRFFDLQKLEAQNRILQRERAVERIRSQVQSMEQASDFKKVLSVLAEDLKSVNLNFDTCEIDVLDELADEPTMADFEAGGLHYTTYAISNERAVTDESHHLSAPFADIIQETIERFLAGHHWQGLIDENTAIVEVPIFHYGRLRITTLNHRQFTDEEIRTLQDFAGAIALGYTRFLDLKAVEEAQQRLIDEMEEELRTAHEMQMNLMPKEAPQIEGVDIAGRCIPATHVGGDFFQYFEQNGKLALTMADVTGHAMEAAIPVVMFSGILDSQMEHGVSVEDLFNRLNNSMYRNLDGRTFVCFEMGELDLFARTLRLCNAACPYPYHFHAETHNVNELQVEAYPLGVRSDTTYDVIETQLYSGDCVVFLSDGIIEAGNEEDEPFGFERTTEVIWKACQTEPNSEAIIDRILEDVAAFKGSASQTDDMTCVVLRLK